MRIYAMHTHYALGHVGSRRSKIHMDSARLD